MPQPEEFDRSPPPHESAPPWGHGWPEITDPAVQAAFARVDRARFVPQSLRDQAERDAPLPIGEGQTISQPFVVALMVQALALDPGSRVLEVGTGSGYQTAILCELTRRSGQPPGATVYTIERHESLLRTAAPALHAAGYAPQMARGDGAAGWPQEAPFDGIIVSAAAAAVPRPLVGQLAPKGRLVIPVGSQGDEQGLWLIRRGPLGRPQTLQHTYLGPVRFVPLISPLLDDPANRLSIG